jgi:hypothetical protein
MKAIEHTAALPFGYTALFRWRDGAAAVEWTPEVPRIRSNRARRKFMEAYAAARRAFYTDVAAVVGGAVAVVDYPGCGFEAVAPPVRH